MLTLVGGIGLPISALAATTGSSGCCKTSMAKGPHKEFKAMHEKLLSEAKADDAALEKMVAELNNAPEAKKVDLEAAILTKLVAQHHQMLANMESMHARRMQSSNQHMELGKSQAHGGGDSTSTVQR